jgi:hypothetical protein
MHPRTISRVPVNPTSTLAASHHVTRTHVYTRNTSPRPTMADPLGTLDPGSTLREVQDVYERTQTPSNDPPSESSSSDQSTQTPQHNPSSGPSDCGSTRSTSTVVPAPDRRRRTPPSGERTLERSPPSYGTIPSGGGNFEAGGVPVSPTRLEAGYDGAQGSVERLIYVSGLSSLRRLRHLWLSLDLDGLLLTGVERRWLRERYSCQGRRRRW